MCVVGSVWLPLANIKSAPSQRASKEVKTAGCVSECKWFVLIYEHFSPLSVCILTSSMTSASLPPLFLTRKYQQLRKDTKRVGMERKTKRPEALKMQESSPFHSVWSLSLSPQSCHWARLISIANERIRHSFVISASAEGRKKQQRTSRGWKLRFLGMIHLMMATFVL